MAHSREAIVAKIKACLNLSKPGANTTEAEMATALDMAKALMNRYNLSEAEVLAEGVSKEAMDMADQVVPTRQNPHRYEQFLAVVCEVLFSVKAVIHRGWNADLQKRVTTIKFYGTKTDVMVAAAAYELLRNTINEMALRCPFKLAERDQWRLGVVVTLLRRAREADERLTAAEQARCRDLVLVKTDRINEYIQKKAGKLGKARASRVRATPGFRKGRVDGETVGMDMGKAKQASSLPSDEGPQGLKDLLRY